MEYLLFKVTNKNFQHLVVSPETIYILNDKQYALLNNSNRRNILNDFNQISKEKISGLIISKRKKEVSIYDLKGSEILKFNFSTFSMCKKFIDVFPKFKRDFDDSTPRIHPIIALLLMLFTYSFIWAGTRSTLADINPEGIRWRLAYLNVKFLERLNSLIGQKLILCIGIILLFILTYLIFRPEIRNLFWQKPRYSNTTIKENSDKNS